MDHLFGAAELRLGSGDPQQVVRIVHIEKRQAAAPPQGEAFGTQRFQPHVISAGSNCPIDASFQQSLEDRKTGRPEA